MTEKKFTFIDLFAGCGGLTEGFLQTGKFTGLAHVEWELPMVNTLRNRLIKKWNHSEEEANKRVIHFDIRKSAELVNGEWSEESIAAYAATNDRNIIKHGLKSIADNNVDVIIGGPPCQAYSLANRGKSTDNNQDYRNYLFESFVEILTYFRPKLFVFENVVGMLSAKPGGIPVTDRIYQAFDDADYEILPASVFNRAIFSAADYEVPQKRRRVILIGLDRKQFSSSLFTLESVYTLLESKKSKKGMTVRDAIGSLPGLYPVSGSDGRKISHVSSGSDNSHNPRFHNPRDVEIFKKWILNKMNNFSTEEKIRFYKTMVGKDSKLSKYRNLEWDKPSNTIVAHLYKDGLLFIHPDPEQARSITVREAALLQSFPSDYEFNENMGANYQMIGNAVPPLMASQIGVTVHQILSNN